MFTFLKVLIIDKSKRWRHKNYIYKKNHNAEVIFQIKKSSDSVRQKVENNFLIISWSSLPVRRYEFKNRPTLLPIPGIVKRDYIAHPILPGGILPCGDAFQQFFFNYWSWWLIRWDEPMLTFKLIGKQIVFSTFPPYIYIKQK